MLKTSQIHIWCRTIATFVLLLAAGCSVQPVQMVVTNNPQSGKALTATDQNQIPELDKDIQYGNLCRVKYHPAHTKNHPVVIEGTLGKGKKYPVILDTGASVGLFVNDIHIKENNLVTRPFKYNNSSGGWGTSYIPELNIGETKLLNWPCYYKRQHAELKMFGLTLAKDKSVIVGLPTLLEFKYVAFDNVEKEVEFSPKEVFEPSEPARWEKFSLTVEEFLGGNVYLFVKIPIAGEEVELQLDTGSGKGLAANKEIWQQIQQKIKNVKLKKSQELYPYIGWMDCEQGVAAKLDVGDRTIKNAKVSIYPENSPLMENCEGLLGMQYFQDTVMVLDFERNLMWVKHPRS